ncbi:MAG: hypothetical protein V4550_05570 [Gemmatimonadota bacterium]
MRKLLLSGLLLAAACKSTTTIVPAPAPEPAPGVVTSPAYIGPRPAVDAFLAAVKAQDIQALSGAWGDKEGPVRDSKKVSRADMEMRALVILRCLRHERWRVVAEAPSIDGERVFQIELVRGTQKGVTDFFTAQASDRWYVRTVNLDVLKEYCSAK